MNRVKIAAELVRIAGDLAAGVRTAKVDYQVRSAKKATMTVVQAQPDMAAKAARPNAAEFRRKVDKAVKQVARALEDIPAFTGPVSYQVNSADDVILSSSRGGLLFVVRAQLDFNYDGDRDPLWAIFHEEVPPAFKAVGIRA